jgi:hypothetical protein
LFTIFFKKICSLRILIFVPHATGTTKNGWNSTPIKKRNKLWNLFTDRVNLSQNTYSLLQHVVKIFPCLRSLTLTNYERSEAFLDGRPWRNDREGEQG